MDIICASICYRGWAEDEIAGTLANAPAIGYRSMEIHGPATWSVAAVDAFDLPGMKAAIEKAGMRCAGIYSPGWGGTDAADVSEHARSIAACVRYAEALGARHVTSTGVEPRGARGARGRVIECARLVLEQIDPDTPVRLALEPHYGNVLQNAADLDTVLTAVPDDRLGVCVDTGHFHSAGVDTPGFIVKHAGRLVNVHLKDHVGTVSMGIGRGKTDIPSVIEALYDADYDEGITVELEVEDPENLPRYTHEAYVYLSGLLGQKL